jgi:hypothetical protein
MTPVETVPGMGAEGTKENDGRVNSARIYWKKFCNCHNESQYNNNMIIKK